MVNLSSGTSYGETKELRRSIVFYSGMGKIETGINDIEFDNYKTNNKFINIKNIKRL